ncbi:MAG: hypothetical protein FWH15_06715, partial [Betaproteobacteria bacterium]|nr:hypothetical protein [Betaproteobacteria bacterium]
VGLYAKRAKTMPGSVTGEAFPDNLAADSVVVLEKSFVRDLEIQSGSQTLVEGEHYRLERPEAGHVRILDLTGITQPLTASYQFDGIETFGIFSETPPERWMQMVGVNTLNNEPVIVDLFRMQFDPASNLPLHNEEFGSFELSGSALVDPMLANESELGGFGRLTLRAEED